MKILKHFLIVIILISGMILLSGCELRGVSNSQLKKDLMNSENFENCF